MGTLKSKVESVVTGGLRGAAVELEEIPELEKLSGYVSWPGFLGKPQRERQRELWRLLRDELDAEEQHHLSAILTLTPAEVTTYANEND
jgi:hypothetical protein